MGGFKWKNVRRLPAATLLTALLAAGCASHPTDQQIQQQAAQATQQVKHDAEQAARDARVGAAKAEEKLDAVAAGVRQGLHGNAPGSSLVDLNSASKATLETLPGVTPARANRIIAGRPYASPNDLVAKNVLTQDQFDRISGKVQAQ